jgi:hypothetical protein
MSHVVINKNYGPQERGFAGQQADNGPVDRLSKVAEGRIPFGRLVVRGSGDGTMRLPSVSSDIDTSRNLLGVSFRDLGVEAKDDPAFEAGIEDKTQGTELKEGRIFVKVENAVLFSDTVFIRFKGKNQTQELDWDVDFVTGNTINGLVNGVAITPVPFNSDQATTLADLITAIQASNQFQSVTTPGARVIKVVTVFDKEAPLTTFVVTGGAGQAVSTITETQARILDSERGRFRNDIDLDIDSNSTAEEISTSRFKFLENANTDEIVILDVDV